MPTITVPESELPKLQEILALPPGQLDALVSAIRQADQSTCAEREFASLAELWYRETGALSMIHKKVMHPAYQRIIGMGKASLPFIFRELAERRGHWFWALVAITGEDAAEPHHDFRQAVEAWLEWGRRHGYLKKIAL